MREYRYPRGYREDEEMYVYLSTVSSPLFGSERRLIKDVCFMKRLLSRISVLYDIPLRKARSVSLAVTVLSAA